MRRIGLPSRVQVRIYDSQTGSYPTISRTTGGNRNGQFNVKFDDTKTVVFITSSVLLNYPSLAPSGSSITSNQTSSLSAVANVVKGISDTFVEFNNPGQSLSPFDESRSPAQGDAASYDPFYLTGSRVQDVGLGFSTGLKGKSMIVIDLNPTAEYSASIQNGAIDVVGEPTLAGNWDFLGTQNYPMAYYNFSKKGWEGIGLGYATSITGTQGYTFGNDPLASAFRNIQSGTYGFSPSYAITSSIEGRQAAVPMSNFGFPFHPKFHATSSQLFSLTGSISDPFLVEKIVYEFSASYMTQSMAGDPSRAPVGATSQAVSASNGAPHASFTDQSLSAGSSGLLLDGNGLFGNNGAPISTFFILNQRRVFNGFLTVMEEPVQDPSITFGVGGVTDPNMTVVIPMNMSISKNGPTQSIDTIRDVITYAQVSALGASYTDDNIKLLSRSLNIPGRVHASEYWGGSFVMSESVNSPANNLQVMPMFMGINDTATLLNVFNKPGGRNGLGVPTGRDLVASVLGYQPSASFQLNDPALGATVMTTPGVQNNRVNPYLLLPTDTLAFGWQVPIGTKMFAEGRIGAANGVASALTLKPGKGRLILYGSLIRGAEELHDTLNQALTSPAVHEDVHDDNTVVDAFDTEPIQMYSGSYVAEYITGSMALGRKVIASAVSATTLGGNFNVYDDKGMTERARISGFIRGIQLSSQNERYFDTLLPPIDQVVVKDGSAVYYNSSLTANQVLFGLSNAGINAVPDSDWSAAFPFEARYSDITRVLEPLNVVPSTKDFDTNVVLKTPITAELLVSFVTGSVAVPHVIYQQRPSVVAYSIPFNRDNILHVYGVGTWPSGTVGPAALGNLLMYGSVIRGFKYGILNALPQFSKLVVSKSRYGHLRDVLEQRPFSKFYDTVGTNPDGTLSGRTGATAAAVDVKFVEPRTSVITSPAKTWASNLSTEATSSMPYFDGQVKNRENPLNTDQVNTSIVSF